MTTFVAHPAATDEIVLPTQTRPVPTPPPVAVELEGHQLHDHVRTHGRSCWWNFLECRWECSRG